MDQEAKAGSVTSETPTKKRTPLLLLPFVWSWRLATMFVNRTGILYGLLAGLFLLFVGYILVNSIIGFVLGLPIFFMGALITLRALY